MDWAASERIELFNYVNRVRRRCAVVVAEGKLHVDEPDMRTSDIIGCQTLAHRPPSPVLPRLHTQTHTRARNICETGKANMLSSSYKFDVDKTACQKKKEKGQRVVMSAVCHLCKQRLCAHAHTHTRRLVGV